MTRPPSKIAAVLLVFSLVPFSLPEILGSHESVREQIDNIRSELHAGIQEIEDSLPEVLTEFGPAVANEMIVKYKGSQTFEIQKLPQGKALRDAEREFELLPTVEYADPNYIAHAYVVPNDPYYV